jgi:ABC-type phosphate/phosphonate transport system substrate-binding protein
MLIARYKPELTENIRVLTSTATAPMPAFVTAKDADPALVARLRSAFAQAHRRNWFPALGEKLLIRGFAPVDHADFAETLRWDREAKAAGYSLPG